MRNVIVRYKVKRDRLDEHEALLRAVFEGLKEALPAGIRYGAFKQADGQSYVHVALITASSNPLDALPSFKAFTAGIRDRCEIAPETTVLTQLGGYGFG